jgi:hypothetical protein
MKKQIQWTEDEIGIIKEHYPSGGIKQVMELLPHRTRGSIHHKAHRMGIKYDNSPWNKKEIRILTDNYPKGGKKLVRELLPHRTYYAIRSMAYELRIVYENYFAETGWTEEELDIITKWYPLVGIITEEKTKKIIGTPNLLEMLPRKTRSSIRTKVFRLGLKYNPQLGVPNDRHRCLLCLKIKSPNSFQASYLEIKTYKCIKCVAIIKKSQYRDDPYWRLGTNLQRLAYDRTGEKIPIDKIRNRLDKIIELQGFSDADSIECYFEDNFCDNKDKTLLTFGHKIPPTRGGDPLDPKNLFFLCMRHNALMSNLKLSEFIDAMRSIKEALSKLFIKKGIG